MSGREIIDQYIAIEPIQADIGTDYITEEESHTAALNTQRGRAQYVVDKAAGMLLTRKASLVDDSRELKLWQQEVDDAIEEIDAAFLLSEKHKTKHASLPEKRRELVKASLYGEWDTFLQIMDDEPPFVLTTKYGPGMWRWINDRGKIFEDVYDLKGGTCTRAFSELLTAMRQIGGSLEADAIITIQLEDGSPQQIKVLQPKRFFEQLAANRGGRVGNRYTMGPRLASAILCIADVQQEEREIAKTTAVN